jgi:hypothetical protein
LIETAAHRFSAIRAQAQVDDRGAPHDFGDWRGYLPRETGFMCAPMTGFDPFRPPLAEGSCMKVKSSTENT